MVVQELDVTGVEHHREVKLLAAGQAVEQRHGLFLLRAQARHVLETLGRDDVRAHIATGESALVLVEDRLLVVRRRARNLLGLPAPAERLVQHFEQIGAGAGDLVVHRHRAGDHAQAARARGAQHEQADDVAAVGVVGELLVGGVAAALGAVHVDVHVAHVAQDVAVGTLRDRRAQVLAQAPVHQAQVALVVFGCREAANHEQACAVLQEGTAMAHQGCQRGQRKVFAGHGRQGLAQGLDMGQRRAQFGDFVASQLMDPVLARSHLGGAPVGRGLDHGMSGQGVGHVDCLVIFSRQWCPSIG